MDEQWAVRQMEFSDLQAARSRLFLLLDGLVDCDATDFIESLLDVATLRARHARLKAADRVQWERLAAALQGCLSPPPEAKASPVESDKLSAMRPFD